MPRVLVAWLMVSSFATVARAETELVAEIGLGRDTNTYREPASATRSSMMPASLRFSHESLPGTVSRFFVTAEGAGSFYPHSNRDGASWNAGAALGYERRLIGSNRRFIRSPSLDLTVQGSYSELHRTFYSRTAGEEFIVIVDGDTVSLRNRYNLREVGGEADLSLRWPRSTVWSISGAAGHRNYLDDYTDVRTVDPLDYDHTTMCAGLRQNLIGPVRLDLSYTRESLDYDSLTARDLDGNAVAGHIQRFRYRRTEATLSNRYMSWGHVKFSVQYKTRTDPFMGYYDYKQWEIRPLVQLTVIPRTDLLLIYDYEHRDYARARVGYNPVKPLREDFNRSANVQVFLHVKTGQAVIAAVVHESTTEKNAAYTYRRTRSWLGYQVRL